MTPRHETDRTGGGTTPRDVHLRTELAHHLRGDVFPATRGQVLAHLREDAAPADVMALAETLPDDARRYANVQDVAAELGLRTGRGSA